jgi:hypothetical protein
MKKSTGSQEIMFHQYHGLEVGIHSCQTVLPSETGTNMPSIKRKNTIRNTTISTNRKMPKTPIVYHRPTISPKEVWRIILYTPSLMIKA